MRLFPVSYLMTRACPAPAINPSSNGSAVTLASAICTAALYLQKSNRTAVLTLKVPSQHPVLLRWHSWAEGKQAISLASAGR